MFWVISEFAVPSHNQPQYSGYLYRSSIDPYFIIYKLSEDWRFLHGDHETGDWRKKSNNQLQLDPV
jgi:hypothetical protein